jgi:transposase
MDSADCVRNYKALANVERAFRLLKTIDLKVRPIHHRTADRVRAHILRCMQNKLARRSEELRSKRMRAHTLTILSVIRGD